MMKKKIKNFKSKFSFLKTIMNKNKIINIKKWDKIAKISKNNCKIYFNHNSLFFKVNKI